MFACTKTQCPKEVIRRRRVFSAEKCRFREQEEHAREVRERKQHLQDLRHEERVDYLHRRPCEDPTAAGDDSENKRRAKVEHAKLVVWRKEQLEKQRQSQLLHDLKQKESSALRKGQRSVRSRSSKNDDEHIRQVQEKKALQLKEKQETAEMGFDFRTHMADLRLEELRKARVAACETLKQKKQEAARRVLEKHKQIGKKEAEIVQHEIELKNQKANYVLGIEPEPPLKSLYRPRPKVVPEPYVPPKYNFLGKTYNLEFLRLKFKTDEATWHRRNRDFALPTLDEIIAEWKVKSRFEDPDLQFGEVQKEFANADETLRLEQKFEWISRPVSVQVLEEVGLASFVSSEEEYAALDVRAKIDVHAKMRGRQTEIVEEEIDRRAKRQQLAGEKLAQLERPGVDKDAEQTDAGAQAKLDYAEMLYRNVLERWNTTDKLNF